MTKAIYRRIQVRLWFQRRRSPSLSWRAAWQQACGHDTGQQLRVHIPVHKQGAMTGKLATIGPYEASKPTPMTHFLQQSHTSKSFSNSSTDFGSHVQTLECVKAILIQLTARVYRSWVLGTSWSTLEEHQVLLTAQGPCIDCFYIKGVLDLIKCLSWVHQKGSGLCPLFCYCDICRLKSHQSYLVPPQ